MNYTEYRQMTQKSFDDLPIFFAFGKDQFREAMEERGLTENDTDQVYSLGAGALYLKKDKDIIHAWFNRKDMLPELMKDPVFAEEAFYEELANHEYFINYEGDYDVCSVFVNCEWSEEKTFYDYLKEGGYDHPQIEAFIRARRRLRDDWIESGIL